jgi:GWxTD domain-containing protein
MRSSSILSGIEGHPEGGPRRFTGRGSRTGAAALFVITLALAACGARGADSPRPGREPFTRPLDIYRDLGFITGPGQFPVVASFSTLAGPADSTYVLLGLSLPNNALRFQRDGSSFVAEYSVDLTFMDADSVTIQRFSARETVRIPSFAEAGRSDESVVFQRAFAVTPGDYIVRLQAGDVHSARGFSMMDTLTAPAYGMAGARVASPMLVYQSAGRRDRADLPELILNPRHTVPFGGEAPVLYLEAYDTVMPGLEVEVLSETGESIWRGLAALDQGTGPVRFSVMPLPSETFPLGRFWVHVAAPGAAAERTPLVLTISDHWMVSNFEDVLQFLRYIAYPDELELLRRGTPAERREQWEAFWARRDPLPITGVNEYREQFFQRVRYATEAFREPGRAGWQTDRGEVYIVLGPPDQAVERYLGRNNLSGRPNAEEWIYSSAAGGRLNLLFHDRTGFGRLDLIPSSASAFRGAAERIRPRLPRN